MMKSIARFTDVSVETDCKWKKEKILDGVNLTIPEKTIVGLIGPSGCGKTTLFRALINFLPIRGSLHVCGRSIASERSPIPGAFVGYMPQDIGLNELWTAKDLFRYTGRLFGMESSEMDRRIEAIRDKIDLPQSLGFMSRMSGGEKRRVSLALALIHQPRLLLLDEPTVGSDPLTRVKIWNYLEECRDIHGMTIVITTHYIDEVRKADTIAYMYQGRLLRHDIPQAILAECQTDNLEEASRVLCTKFNECAHKKNSASYDPFSSIQSSVFTADETNKISHVRTIISSFLFVISEFRFHLAIAIFFSFWFVLFTYIIICFLWRPPLTLPLCVVSHKDEANFSGLVAIKLNQAPISTKLCTLQEATESCLRGETIGFLEARNGFPYLAADRDLADFTGDELFRRFYLHANFADKIKVEYVLRFLEQRIPGIITEQIQDETNVTSNLQQIVHIDPTDGKSVEDNDRRLINYLVSHFLLYLCYQFSQSNAGFGLIFNRMNSFYERQRSMGIKPWHLVVAHLIRENVVITPIFLFFSFCLLLFLQINLDRYFLQFLFILYMVSLSGISLGLCFGSCISTIFGLMCTLFGYNITLVWINGCVWPREILPYFMKPVTLLYSYGMSIEVAQRVIRGSDQPLFGGHFLMLLSWIAVCIFLAIKNLK